MKILIIGNGYVGNRCKDAWGDEAVIAECHVNNKEDMLALLDKHNPEVSLANQM